MDNFKFDKIAHAFTATYVHVQLSTSSVRAELSQCGAGEIDYHMYKINSYTLTGDADQYKVRVTAYHNLRDYAK
ncbi:hypothetical protein OnM2_061077 [Erysiphe neolycopersici]|uniref:Uncharacterized protein n=1 Tax=Erysiphe neolycopersici TaxID=212602 RepID=A0A420HPD6_9PEZI|nr:hypothetical protein OnM2_061077 [Erysiphe neolycopersici]